MKIDEIKQRLMQMELAVGYGEDHFTMSRGSFRYKRKTKKMEKLQWTGTEEKEDGFILVYQGKHKAREHLLKVRMTDPVRDVVYDAKTGKAIAQYDLEVRYLGMREAGGKCLSDTDINRYQISLPSNPGEHIYGCGETYAKLDLKGEEIRIWVAEHQNTNRISKKIIREKILGKRPEHVLAMDQYESYYAQPTFTSSEKYFLHVDTNRFSTMDFRDPEKILLNMEEAPRFYIGVADDFESLSGKLSELLGRQHALPDWIYDGVILGIQEGPEVIEAKLAKAKESGTKVCGVWSQDWCGCRRTGFGYQVMWNWHYDEDLYPELPKKIQEWNRQGVKFLGYINPFIALEKDLYQEAKEKGYCVKDKEGKDYLVTITTFPAAMVDFTNPKAYAWYKSLIRKNMIDIGMSGWMADFGEYLPLDAVLFDGSDPAVMHNQWPAIWARMNREAIQECDKEGEVFFFTRAGHTETIKYSNMMWTGDQHVDWSLDDGMPSVIPATLSLAMSGYGTTHSDVGGYTTVMQMRRSRELLMRWEEMNVFSPLWRSHEGNQPVNDVQFDGDQELLEHLGRCSRMHTGLKPYLKELQRQQADAGTPVMRPLFYHYDEDRAYTEQTEYLLGRDILVAPILVEGRSSRRVYLPEDKWIHIFTGQMFHGGTFTIDAPMGQPPVFVREEAVMAEEILAMAGTVKISS